MRIRRATALPTDADAMIVSSVSPGVGRRHVQAALERLDSDHVIVAEVAGAVVGWASAGIRDVGCSHPGWYCKQVHVRFDHRRNGIGAALVEDCLAWMLNQKATEVRMARPAFSKTWVNRWGFGAETVDFTLGNSPSPKDGSWILFRAAPPIL